MTGASRGIGRAIAVALASVGFDVAIAAVRCTKEIRQQFEPDTGVALPGSLDATASAIAALGRRAVAIRLDLVDLAALAPAVETAIGELGHLDVLVNNALYIELQERNVDLSTPSRMNSSAE